VRIEGPDKPGIGARITNAVADACISFRGLLRTVLGRRFVAYLTLDSPDDAAKAMRVLRKLS
jgi:predicted amino acid-binding ACT domain protein